MIVTLDQLNGLVNVVDCDTCKGKASIVYLNDKAGMKDDKGKPVLAKPITHNHIIHYDQRAGTHLIKDNSLSMWQRIIWCYKILTGK